jgi:phosphonate transport system ATP-binding protein
VNHLIDPHSPLLTIQGLHKSYGMGPVILDGIDLRFYPGEFVVILGLSGAGKSTFLRCLNRLVEPSSGQINVPGQVLGHESVAAMDVCRLRSSELRRWRQRVGMIFQQFNLVRRLSVLDNVLSGSLGSQSWLTTTCRWFPADVRMEAMRNLDRVALLEQAHQRADTLSGGQQQRVAIARALMQRPALILADEPVASLDPRLSNTILETLQRIAKEDGITVLVSLHVVELAKRFADRIVGFQGGRIVFDGPPETLTDDNLATIYQREGDAPARST